MIELLGAPTEPNTHFVVVYEYGNLICSGMYWINHKGILYEYNDPHDEYEYTSRKPGYLSEDSSNHKYFIR